MKFLFNLNTYNRARSVAKFQLFGVLVSSRSYCNNCLGESSHREVHRRTGANFLGCRAKIARKILLHNYAHDSGDD